MKNESKKRRTPKLPRSPINRRETQSVLDYSGFLTIRLRPGVVSNDARSLDEVAERFALREIATLLNKYNLPSQRLVTSLSVEQLLELEGRTPHSEFEPLPSMTSYWRLDARQLRKPLEEVLLEFRALPRNEVDFAYLEKSATEPAINPGDDSFAAEQNYLDPEPIGIDARSAWDKGGDGAGMHFIDLERGWFLGHEDLPATTLICNCNHRFSDRRDHGTAVLAVVAGVDNDRGIVGIAPKLDSVRVVSRFRANSCKEGHKDETCEGLTGDNMLIVDAICAAIWATPRPHVLLLEVQLGTPALPTETDDAVFTAIQRAVDNDVIVIEAAGNGGQNLDNLLTVDSGAILVGAAEKKTRGNAHDRLAESNFGSRVDCYAWGKGIVSAGFGDRHLGRGDNTTYTATFSGTSGASAIIAGAALLVQGLHLKAQRPLLSPAQMRSILSDAGTGTRQGTAVPGHIGVMPDLRRIIQTLGL